MSKKYRILFLAELLCFLLALLLCFRKEEQIYLQTGEGILQQQEGAIWNSEEMQLTPGVYQIRVRGVILEGGSVYFTLACEDSTFQALRCNGANMYAGQETLDFEAYVVDTVDSACLQCQFQEVSASDIASIELYRINWGGRILCFLILAGSILLNCMIRYRDLILSGRIGKKQQAAVWVLLASVGLAYFPYAVDYFSIGGNLTSYLLRIEDLKETLPFGVHGDLFLLIPVCFRMIGFSLMTSYKLFVLIVMAATAGIAFYSFQRCTKDVSAALFGSVIYMLEPYRLYCFYNRGAVGEYLGMTFLPLVLCGMYCLYTEETEDSSYKKAKIPLITGLSCILQSHVPTFELAALFILFFCVVLWRRTLRKRTILQLMETAAFCLLINCRIWLSLLVRKETDLHGLGSPVSTGFENRTSLAAAFQLYPNMGSDQNGMYHSAPVHPGAAVWFLLCIFLFLFGRKLILKRKGSVQRNPYDTAVLLFAGAGLAALFLNTGYFSWNFQALGIQYSEHALQLSAGLLSFACAFCAVFAAFFVVWLREELQKLPGEESRKKLFGKGVLLFAGIIAAGSAVYHVNDIAYESPAVRLYTAENLGTAGMVNGAYLTAGAEQGANLCRAAEIVSLITILCILIFWAVNKSGKWKEKGRREEMPLWTRKRKE